MGASRFAPHRGTAVFAKLCAVVISIGVVGCALLALRQSRLQAASELTQAQLRIAEHDRSLWRLRAQIAERTTPREIEEMAAALGPLVPMVPDAQDVPPLGPVPVIPGMPAPRPKVRVDTGGH